MELIGPYRIDALVGRGRAGAVWRATRTGAVAREVAIKRARATAGRDGADRLRHEASVLADLDHPHIVRVVDVLDDGDDVAIVMSLARGGSLHDLLAERDRLSAGETVAVLARIAEAVDSAHRRGVLHGDVKPANILFTSDGEPLLGDFGVAQLLDPTRPGIDGRGGVRAVEGTTGYVDPELVATGRPEPRNDVYGLAVVAYLCLTGRLPHDGATARDVLAAADVGQHPPVAATPGVPPRLASLVEAGLARHLDARPPTAGDFARVMRTSVDPATIRLPGVARLLAPPATDSSGPVAAADGGPRADGTVGPNHDLARPAVGPGPAVGRVGAPGRVPGPGEPMGASDRRREPVDVPGSDGHLGRGGVVSRVADGATIEPREPPGGRRATRAFGPRPERAEPEAAAGRPWVSALVVAMLVSGVVGGALVFRHRLAAEQAPTAVDLAGADRPSGVECPHFEALPVPPGASRLEGDLRGDGCVHQVVWDGREMRFWLDPDDAAPRRYDFSDIDGSPAAGQMFLGDWNCDGVDTPALYRPSNGVVAYFAEVPGRVRGRTTASNDPTGVVGGRARLVAGGAGECDRVGVVPEA